MKKTLDQKLESTIKKAKAPENPWLNKNTNQDSTKNQEQDNSKELEELENYQFKTKLCINSKRDTQDVS